MKTRRKRCQFRFSGFASGLALIMVLSSCSVWGRDCSNLGLIRTAENFDASEAEVNNKPSYMESEYFSNLDIEERVISTNALNYIALIRFANNEVSRTAYQLYVNQIDEGDVQVYDFQTGEPRFQGQMLTQSVDNLGDSSMMFRRDTHSPYEPQPMDDAISILAVQHHDYLLISRRSHDFNDWIVADAEAIVSQIDRCSR